MNLTGYIVAPECAGQGVYMNSRFGQEHEHRFKPLRSLVPPMAEQFGIEAGNYHTSLSVVVV